MEQEKVTQEEYQKAHEIIERAKKQAVLERKESLMKIISEHSDTYWKKTESLKSALYFHIVGNKGYFDVTSYATHTNGKIIIERHYMEAYAFDKFVGANLANRVDVFDDDDYDSCHCPQIDHPHATNQHTPLTKITKDEFEKNVQTDVLDKVDKLGISFDHRYEELKEIVDSIPIISIIHELETLATYQDERVRGITTVPLISELREVMKKLKQEE